MALREWLRTGVLLRLWHVCFHAVAPELTEQQKAALADPKAKKKGTPCECPDVTALLSSMCFSLVSVCTASALTNLTMTHERAC